MKDELDLEVEFERGRAGQFDVLADGELVASKDEGFLAKFFGGGWPDEDEIVTAIAKRL